jgi:hypothetical protein
MKNKKPKDAGSKKDIAPPELGMFDTVFRYPVVQNSHIISFTTKYKYPAAFLRRGTEEAGLTNPRHPGAYPAIPD